MKVHTTGAVVDYALNAFHILEGGTADLVPTGLEFVDNQIGGLSAGAVGLLAGDTGVGKSSLLLYACTHSDNKIGVISAEDMPDVVGSRILSECSGVNSLRMRQTSTPLGHDELEAITDAGDALRDQDRILWCFPPRKTLDGLREACEALIESGVEIMWLDYIQKFRGVGGDRRNEISQVFTTFQEECQGGDIPGMAISQFRRRDMSRQPTIYHMKESGDLENECRLAVLAWQDLENPRVVCCKIAKSTYGGSKAVHRYYRSDSGSLVPQESEVVEW